MSDRGRAALALVAYSAVAAPICAVWIGLLVEYIREVWR